MLRYKIPDGRRSALRLRAALLVGITAAATAAAPAHADLSHAALAEVSPNASAGVSANASPNASVVAPVVASGAPADWRRLLEPASARDDAPVHQWLSQAWPLGLAVQSGPAAMLTLWLTGGVHQVLSWIAQPRVESGEDAEGGEAGLVSGLASDEALERALGLITVEPVTGAETSSYGYRRDPFTRRRKLHKGVDYRAPRGTPVFAAGPGVVRVARRKSGYGRVIMLDHGAGVETRYAHLQSIDVDAGERVSSGARIGTVGSTGRATGPHLHFELRIDGDAHDPQEVLGPLLSAGIADSAY